MKKLLLIVTTLLAIGMAGAASGADLPNIKGPSFYTPSPVFSWTGFYVGANAGFSVGEFRQTWDDFGVPYSWDSARSGGFSGGGQAGFNYQFPASNFVVGVETDFQGSTLKGTYADYGSNNLQFGSQIDWWGTARARFGYAFGNILPYVTGGFAYGHLTNSYYASAAEQPPGYSETWSNTRTGWTVGGGLEYAITPDLTLKVEYLYTDLGSWYSQDPQNATYYPGEYHNNVRTTFNTGRAGLNWKFDWLAPPSAVVARY